MSAAVHWDQIRSNPIAMAGRVTRRGSRLSWARRSLRCDSSLPFFRERRIKGHTDEPFTYQWYKNHKRISGANKPTHVIQKLKLSDAANYSVIVKNSVGNIESNEAKLTVKK